MTSAASSRAVVLVAPGRGVDLALLDALCRTVLAARRRGLRLEVRTDDARLLTLVRLAGLGDALAGCASGQPQRQAEPEEHRVAEEVVDVGDPPV